MKNSYQVPFIDREEEIKEILAEVKAWGGKNIVCLTGEGGIGKTRLLREVHLRFQENPPGFETRSDQEIKRIALVQPFTATEWSAQFITAAQEMSAELGASLQIYDAGFDIEKMAADVDLAAANSPEAILVRLGTDEKLRPAIERAIAAGIPVVLLDNYLVDLHVTTRLTQDFMDCGYQLAKKMCEDLNYQGNILIVCDNREVMQRYRYGILNSYLQTQANLKVVGVFGQTAPEMTTAIYDETLTALKAHPGELAIWSAWDEYTSSIVQAISASGRTDVRVYSYGVSQSQLGELLTMGNALQATVDVNPCEVGRFAIRMAVLAALGEPLELQYPIRSVMLDRAQAAEMLEASGSLALTRFPIITGWSQRLYERKSLFSQERRLLPPLPIFDFDDYTFRDSRNILHHIAIGIGPEIFKPYLEPVQSEEAEESSAISSARLSQSFIECFTQAAYTQRVMLFFDTVDDRSQLDILQEILAVFSHLSNFVILIAGRKANWLARELEQTGHWRGVVKEITLKPFTEKFGQDYLLQKQELLGFHIKPEVMTNLLLLANGRPILIDLAAEWLSHDIPLDWLLERKPEELQNELEGSTREKMIQEFERHLIQHIGQTRREMDWVILLLARIYPMDAALLSYLRGLPAEKAERQFTEAHQVYTFVKLLPDGQIKLHDVMQKMVNDYLWPQVDPTGERRIRDSQQAMSYYETMAGQLRAELEAAAKTGGDALADRVRSEKLRQMLATSRGQYLKHLFHVNPEQASQKFVDMFEDDSRALQFSSREILLQVANEFAEQLPFKEQYRISMRWARHLNDRGQYERSETILQRLRRDPQLTAEQLLGVLTTLAYSFLQNGAPDAAILLLKEAEGTCLHKKELERFLGRILNTLGRAYRLKGEYRETVKHYLRAEQAGGEPHEMASILNDMGHVYSLEGNYSLALDYCNDALEIRQRIGDIRGIGATYTTIGEVYRNWGKYSEALKFYNLALDIFQPEKVNWWLAWTYSHRGAVYRLMGSYSEAHQDLDLSIKFNIKTEKPWAYHVLGCVYWNEGKLDKGLELFHESYKMAREIQDARTLVNNLVGEAEIYLEMWLRSGKQDQGLPDKIAENARQLQQMMGSYEFPHHQGRMCRVLGDLAFEQGQLRHARRHYAVAYSLFGKRSAGYGRRTFTDEVNFLKDKTLLLAQKENPAETASDWVRFFRHYWYWRKGEISQAQELLDMCRFLEGKIRRISPAKGTNQ